MRLSQHRAALLRLSSATAARRTNSTVAAAAPEYPDGWATARPYKSIPGPSRWEYYRWFQPGGELFGSDQLGIQTFLHKRYGQMARLPGSLGQRDIVYTFNPDHYKTIWRTESAWPRRQSLDVLAHYRDLRPEVFKDRAAGLLSDNGEQWHKLRSVVTPVVMSPKITKSNMPEIDQIAREFVERIGSLRDGSDEMPANFMRELDMWALESVGVAALDRRLGMIRSDRDEEAVQLMIVSWTRVLGDRAIIVNILDMFGSRFVIFSESVSSSSRSRICGATSIRRGCKR